MSTIGPTGAPLPGWQPKPEEPTAHTANATGSEGEVAITAHKGPFFKRADLQLRRFNREVTLPEIREAIKDNNYDEVIFKTPAGERFAVYADELKGNVKAGDAIEVSGVKGTVEVVDNEWNEKAGSVAFIAAGGILGAALTATAGPAIALLGSLFGVAHHTNAAAMGGYLSESDELLQDLSAEVKPDEAANLLRDLRGMGPDPT